MSGDRRYRVFYVDEDRQLLDSAKISLEKSQEFTVDIFASPRDALDSGILSSYDAIISGHRMPAMDGIAFLKEVRSRFGTIPFILFTEGGREEVFLEALDNGADFFLQSMGDAGPRFAELIHVIKMAVEHRRAVDGIIVQNRLYSVLSATNKAIVLIRDKTGFFSEICRILVEIGGFRMVWIGLADTTKKSVEPVASCGHIDGYFDCINISTEDVPNGRGPTGTAYRTGTYNFSNDILTDPLMAPWQKPAVRRGYLASAAFPFAIGTRNEGVITLYAPKAGFFDAQVIDLLEKMARDVSFALMTIDEEDHRKEAEHSLRESEERYRILFDTMAEGFSIDEIVLDKTGKPVDLRYLKVNPAFERQTGLKAEHVIGRTTRELFPGAEPVWFEKYGDVVLTGKPAHFEEKFGPLGRWYDVMAYKTGELQFAVLFTDITERRRAEDELRNSEEHLQLFVRHAPASLAMFDRDMRYLAVSHRWIADYQLGSQEILGRSHYEIFPEITDSWKDVHRRALAGEIVQADEDIFVREDGTVQWLAWEVRPWYTPEKTVGGIVIFSEDISRRKKAEEELIKKNDDLHFLNEELTAAHKELRHTIEELVRRELDLNNALAEKEVLLSEVHHRVKNNLTALISLLSLEGSTEETPAGKMLKMDLQNRARSMALIHETLYRTHKYDEVDMGVYLSTLIDQIANSIKSTRPVKILVNAQGIMMDIPRATPAGLIINELVTNSFKYAFPESFDVQAVRNAPPTISIALSKKDGRYEIIFRDNGVGFPPGFDARTTQTLGLKLVNFLAKHQLRAKVEINSREGTEFIFQFRDQPKNEGHGTVLPP